MNQDIRNQYSPLPYVDSCYNYLTHTHPKVELLDVVKTILEAPLNGPDPHIPLREYVVKCM